MYLGPSGVPENPGNSDTPLFASQVSLNNIMNQFARGLEVVGCRCLPCLNGPVPRSGPGSGPKGLSAFVSTGAILILDDS